VLGFLVSRLIDEQDRLLRETGRRPASGKSILFSESHPTALADIHRQGSSLRPHGFTEGQAEMPITTIKRARERDNEQG